MRSHLAPLILSASHLLLSLPLLPSLAKGPLYCGEGFVEGDMEPLSCAVLCVAPRIQEAVYGSFDICLSGEDGIDDEHEWVLSFEGSLSSSRINSLADLVTMNFAMRVEIVRKYVEMRLTIHRGVRLEIITAATTSRTLDRRIAITIWNITPRGPARRLVAGLICAIALAAIALIPV